MTKLPRLYLNEYFQVIEHQFYINIIYTAYQGKFVNVLFLKFSIFSFWFIKKDLHETAFRVFFHKTELRNILLNMSVHWQHFTATNINIALHVSKITFYKANHLDLSTDSERWTQNKRAMLHWMGGEPFSFGQIQIFCHVSQYVIIMSHTSFRVNLHSIVCLNVKKLLARRSCHIWSLNDSNVIRTHNHLVRKRTLRLRTKWLWVCITLLSLIPCFNDFLLWNCLPCYGHVSGSKSWIKTSSKLS